MEKNQKLIIAHDWLRSLKASKNLSNSHIGQLIGYSNTGIGKALKFNTLSFEQIKVIADKEGALNDFNRNFYENNNSPLDILNDEYIVLPKNIGEYLFKNHDKLMAADTSYEMFIRKIAAEEGLKMIKDLLPKNQ